MTDAPVLSQRALNRTLLERQLLTRRTSHSALQVIEHLVAMQGQEPNWPYIGLWTRLIDFRKEELNSLLQDRKVVRSTMLRRTVHLAVADDFRWLRPTVQPIVSSALKAAFYAGEIEGLDLDELARVGRELLSGQTLTRQEFGRLLVERFPGRHGGRLAESVEIMVAMAHGPATGAWGRWGNPPRVPVTLAEEWNGRPMAASPEPETMIRRYLAAFGPATVMDIQAWSGLTRLREVVEGMRKQLRVLRDEEGRELFDLPGAPLADASQPVPVRFLPAFDNALLGHKDRSRVISDADRKRFAKVASGGVPMFLVDGFVQGTWSVQGSMLLLAPFRPLTEAETAAVLEEADSLLAFIALDAPERNIAFVDDEMVPVNRLHAGQRIRNKVS
ncbi:winged helix DNA-binding domain-containing protein [Streptosporangium minutum]|uniref:Winged helix DNA-binding domain-containing protein n=1 Tax=Streptosporangium minutum TaxID=569862 RepID=A0A243RN05_9ACTN|nr:winged helix DNA-binding domain-containing protein [Streptosporangium minutum]OUC96335.1 hypothetical protein CA984_15270 [Streptosporangium minutum]